MEQIPVEYRRDHLWLHRIFRYNKLLEKKLSTFLLFLLFLLDIWSGPKLTATTVYFDSIHRCESVFFVHPLGIWTLQRRVRARSTFLGGGGSGRARMDTDRYLALIPLAAKGVWSKVGTVLYCTALHCSNREELGVPNVSILAYIMTSFTRFMRLHPSLRAGTDRGPRTSHGSVNSLKVCIVVLCYLRILWNDGGNNVLHLHRFCPPSCVCTFLSLTTVLFVCKLMCAQAPKTWSKCSSREKNWDGSGLVWSNWLKVLLQY